MLIKIASGGICGWGTFALSGDESNTDLVRWASVYMRLRNRSVIEALHIVRSESASWGRERRGIAQTALADLADRLLLRSPHESRDAIAFKRFCLQEAAEAYFSF